MKRKIPLWIEVVLVSTLLGFMTLVMIPKFLAVQNINTPRHFPDPHFRRAVEKFMKVPLGGYFSKIDASRKTGTLSCAYSKIQDLRGLEYFKSISQLNCSYNAIREIDCSANTELTTLSCSNNKIDTLNLENNKKLEYLFCSSNALPGLDLSRNENLLGVNCNENAIQELHIEHCTKLRILFCKKNLISRLHTNSNPALVRVQCSNNNLQALDFSKNPHLLDVDCSYNQIKEIRFADATHLLSFSCKSNLLKDISPVLNMNSLHFLDVQNNLLGLSQLELIREKMMEMQKYGIYSSGFIYLPQKNFSSKDIPDHWFKDYVNP